MNSTVTSSVPSSHHIGRHQYGRRHTPLRSKRLFMGNRSDSYDLRMCSSASSIPYESISTECEEYEIRLYTPRFVIETPYKSRDKAYIAFDQYLTGESQTCCTSEVATLLRVSCATAPEDQRSARAVEVCTAIQCCAMQGRTREASSSKL